MAWQALAKGSNFRQSLQKNKTTLVTFFKDIFCIYTHICGLGDYWSAVAWSEAGASFPIERRSSCRYPSAKVRRNPSVVYWVRVLKEVFVEGLSRNKKELVDIVLEKEKVVKGKNWKWGLEWKLRWIAAPMGVLLRATTAAGLRNWNKNIARIANAVQCHN